MTLDPASRRGWFRLATVAALVWIGATELVVLSQFALGWAEREGPHDFSQLIGHDGLGLSPAAWFALTGVAVAFVVGLGAPWVLRGFERRDVSR